MEKRHALMGVDTGVSPGRDGPHRRYFVSNPQYAEVAANAGSEDSDEIRSPLVHNEYLQLFVELGVAGLLLFAAFWLQVIWRLWRGRRKGGGDSHWVWGGVLGGVAFGITLSVILFSVRFPPG